MKILFTGFTGRTVGSERLTYDYMSNVFVLEKALQLAGHVVDVREVNLEGDYCVEEDYDCALVGIAACQGFSSRFKLGALWAMHRFGKRAGLFPSDGKNIYTFPSSVKTCLTGQHGDRSPFEYFLYGQVEKRLCNVNGHEVAERDPAPFIETLERLPHSSENPSCAWKLLVPTFSWGNGAVYQRHFGGPVTTWDPTNVAIPMQFSVAELGNDGRLLSDVDHVRERSWVLSSLQDQGPWLKKQKCKWPVIRVGNKRAAREGEGLDYIPERELIETVYRKYWGHLAFAYPLADGGWWRMRYVHAGLAGIVTCPDEADARKMPDAYKHSRIALERYSDEKLAEVARDQHQQLASAAWDAAHAVEVVDGFVKGLAQ